MHYSNPDVTRRLCTLLTLAACLCGGVVLAAPAGLSLATPVSLEVSDGRSVTLPVGRSTLLHFQRMKRVEIIEPDLVEVVIASIHDLSLYGRKPGDTIVYVWDNLGAHQIEVTVTAPSAADKLIQDLRRLLGNRLTYTPSGDRAVIVEGTISAEEAQRARAIITSSAVEGLQIVDLIRIEGDETSSAVAVARALSQVLGDKLQYVVWNNSTLLVQGCIGDQAQLERARKILAATAGRGVNIVDLLEYEESAAEAPVEEIQRAVGDQFRVWRVQGKTVGVEGTVPDAAALADLGKILATFEPRARIINLVRVVTPMPDINQIVATLRDVLDDRFSVRPLQHEGIAVEGTVPTAEELARVREIIGKFQSPYPLVDLLRIALPEKQQIVVHVKVMDVNSGDLSRLGLNWGQIGFDSDGSVRFIDQPFLLAIEGGVDNIFQIGAQLDLLAQENLARILAEPNLMVDDGDAATFLVGGEIPVPVSQAGGGGSTTITIEWKEYGVRLEIQPTILVEGNRINLRVAPEVSSLDFANAVSLSGFVVPALRSRRAQTTVTVGNNDCLLLAGLLEKDELSSIRKIPLLGDIPILGELFKRREKQVSESELVIMVTPEIVDKSDGRAKPMGVRTAPETGGAAQPYGAAN